MEHKVDWQKIAQKCLPYVLVVILASATTLAFLGNQDSKLVELGNILDWQFQEQGSADADRLALEASKQEFQETLTETEKLLNQLIAINRDTQDLLQQAEKEEGEVDNKIEQLQGALDAIKDQENQRWVLPMQYTMCTSPFGYRFHPVLENGRFHYGVDLAANQGTPIVASRSGTVTTAAYEADGAGYYVVIDHMDGYVTKYMHMSKYIVSSGQFVFAGQVIGYCGSTGIATGSHLHFGVYHNGEAVDPGQFVDIT